eukprot:scaffold156144_cov44-Prasinocladus_malaysianus.AAC.1
MAGRAPLNGLPDTLSTSRLGSLGSSCRSVSSRMHSHMFSSLRVYATGFNAARLPSPRFWATLRLVRELRPGVMTSRPGRWVASSDRVSKAVSPRRTSNGSENPNPSILSVFRPESPERGD